MKLFSRRAWALRLSVTAAAFLVVAPTIALHAEDDHDLDNPKDVYVAPKRASIGSRSLPRLAELTEAYSPAVKLARDALRVAELQLQNARVTFFPTLDVDLTHGYQDQHPTTKSPWSPYASAFNLVANENLYDNGASLTQLKIATAAHAQANLNFELLRDQQLLTMSGAYLDWSAAVQQREIDENKRDLLRRQYNVLESQYRQGLKTKRDVLRIETEMRRQDMAILTRDNEVDLDYQSLAAAIGVPRADLDREDIEEEEPKPYAGMDENPPELRAQDHKQAKVLDLAHQQSELNVRLQRRLYLPQVFLSGEAGYHLNNYLGTSPSLYQDAAFDWAALVTVRYNLWDFGTRERNIEIARVQAEQVRTQNAQTLLDLGTNLRDVWNKTREYAQDVRMTRELLVLEQQSYNLLESDYRNGRANYLDLIVSLNSLIDARSRYVNAYFGLKKRRLAYAFHKGGLREEIQ